jgi:hypothetical protein
MKVIKGFFSGPNSEGSSKRIMAISCIVAGIVRCFVGAPDPVVLGFLFGTGTTLLGVAAITKT